MPSSGIFVTLFDESSLALYLSQGIFASHLTWKGGAFTKAHFPTLADYGCVREGTHVLFFTKRRIYYGGPAIGSDTHGAFYLNGALTELGKAAIAALHWDESARPIYQASDPPGVFKRPSLPEEGSNVEVCQPYVLKFQTDSALHRKSISSDELYYEIGGKPYPLPSNVVRGQSFCTLTPYETNVVIQLMSDSQSTFDTEADDVHLTGDLAAFSPDIIPFVAAEETSEAQLEWQLCANVGGALDHLVGEVLGENVPHAVARQVPICPFKPFGMDRADMALFFDDGLDGGSLPNVIVELKKGRAGKDAASQINRYGSWLHKAAPASASMVRLVLLAEDYTGKIESQLEYPTRTTLLKLNDLV